MFLLSNRARSNGNSGGSSQNHSPNSAAGRKNLAPDSIIALANQKKKLIDVLNQYGVSLETKGRYSGWSKMVTCPFPSHLGGNERTPSFNYNFSQDRFLCFGCNSSGRAVEFISLKEGIDRLIVAEQIIREVGGYDVIDEQINNPNPKIDGLLFGFATFVHGLLHKNKHNKHILEEIDKFLWFFDLYLVSKIPRDKISVEELELRISQLKEQLDECSKTYNIR